MSGVSIEELAVQTTNGAMRDTLRCLFFHGPTWDGNVPSKSARDALCKVGMVHHEFGFAFLTRDGVELCIRMGFDKEKDRWERERAGR